jgi:hypothetical protein
MKYLSDASLISYDISKRRPPVIGERIPKITVFKNSS